MQATRSVVPILSGQATTPAPQRMRTAVRCGAARRATSTRALTLHLHNMSQVWPLWYSGYTQSTTQPAAGLRTWHPCSPKQHGGRGQRVAASAAVPHPEGRRGRPVAVRLVLLEGSVALACKGPLNARLATGVGLSFFLSSSRAWAAPAGPAAAALREGSRKKRQRPDAKWAEPGSRQEATRAPMPAELG